MSFDNFGSKELCNIIQYVARHSRPGLLRRKSFLAIDGADRENHVSGPLVLGPGAPGGRDLKRVPDQLAIQRNDRRRNQRGGKT